MDYTDIIKLIIGLGLINVWVLRYNKKTEYRGGTANNMLEEFHNYGLSKSFMFLLGFFKISLSLVLILNENISKRVSINLIFIILIRSPSEMA